MNQIKVMPALKTVRRTTERGNWCWMPNAILDYASRGIIDALAVAVYMGLARHSDASSGCYPSVGLLARELGLTRDTVRDRVYQLRDAQLIIIRQRWLKSGKQLSHYYILLEPTALPPLRDDTDDGDLYIVEDHIFTGDAAGSGDGIAHPSGDPVAGRMPADDAAGSGDGIDHPSGDSVAGGVVTDPKIASIKEAYAEAIRRRRAEARRPDRLPPATKPTLPGDDIAKNKT